MDKFAKELHRVIDHVKANLLLELGVALVLVVVAVYVTRKIKQSNAKLRNDSDEGAHAASSLMTNFRELHAKGELSDEEYRTIKTNLVARLKDELKDTDEKG